MTPNSFSDEEPKRSSALFTLLLVAAVVAALAGLMWSYSLAGRLTHAEAELASTQQQNRKLANALAETNARLSVTSETLGHSLGLTQQQLERRADELLRRQNADTHRLETEQQANRKQISSVSTDVAGVKTDVGGVKTGLSQTQTELEQTEAQMKKMQGDLGIESGLIATNSKELDALRHQGDRNYYAFTLRKKKKQAVGTIALELRKADPRHNRYTLWVFSNDKRIEKKNRSLDEPVQFYSGSTPMLFELVINKIGHNVVSGYLSTPKNAPKPVTVSR
jgi:septal ring factor EnvC (AmiA/AmiB activator)